MTNPTFLFSSLPVQVADLIRTKIESGVWDEWLPAERVLTESLFVSRKTLRKALSLLKREGLIETIHGQGNRILRSAEIECDPSASRLTVTLLMPDALESMRQFSSLWVNHLKSLLAENSIWLKILVGHKYFSGQPARALERIVRQYPTNCWLLANSNEAAQKWFEGCGIPCVVAGSCHPGVNLPHVDTDHYALCRHAAGVLLGAGHRNIALLHQRTGRAGDISSESGFADGVSESPHRNATVTSISHGSTPNQICKALERLLNRANPPTAILVSMASSYLTTISYLAHRGVRVPQDISVLSRDDDTYLSAMVPIPGRYHYSPTSYAKKLLKPLLQAIRNEEIQPRQTLILPSYRKGGSIEKFDSDG